MAAPGGVPGRPLHRPSTTVGGGGAATTGYTTALKDDSQSTTQLGARPAYDPSTTDLAGGSTARLAAASNSSTAALSTVGNAGAGKTSKYPPGTKLRKSVKPDNVFLGKMTSERKLWLFIVTLLAGWVPEWVLKLCGIRGKDVIQAWREKFALVMMVVLASVLSIGWLEVSNSLLCPQLLGTMTWYQVATSRNLVIANGRVLDITKSQTVLGKYLKPYVGKDVSSMIPAFTKLAHPAADSDAYADTDFAACVTSVRAADTWIMKRIVTDASGTLNLTADGRLVGCPKPGGRAGETESCFYSDATWRDVNRMVVGDILLDPAVIPKNFSDTNHPSYVVVLTKAYDVTSYLKQAVIYQTDNVATASYDAVQIVPNARGMFLQANFTTALARGVGTDLSGKLTQTSAGAALKCLDKLFFAGRVTPPIFKSICAFGNPMLLAISGSIYSIVVIKFLVSLLFSFRFKPAQMNAYTLCFVPCYTEGYSMRVTLETLAACDYEDAKKLIVVVCDGNITGKGNPAPTPRIALEMLGWQGEEPEPKFYHALGKGADKINMGKAYSGWYTYKEHRVPYIVIAKVGKPDEAKKPKPGNRGKRDSQLILMNFFNKVLNQRPMSPFEYDLYYHIKHVVGVDPKVYEYCLMVDADTEVEPDSMNELVAAMVNDQRKIGVCGETMVSNKWASWVTAIQVHEYYINHHLGKAFESIFGSVTCLPGCFSMYRIRDHKGGAFLVSDEIIEDYKVNKVHTLHSKNLLHLGEDRYLTTLLLKHFPSRRLEFIPSAVCHTDIPDSFAVLLSQRRRWINSTFHNLYEVMKLPRLCSVCFVSMKTLVFMDLLSTLVLPASTFYLYSLIVRMCIEGVDKYYLVLSGLAGLYGSHLFIILLVKKQYEYVVWITVYVILSMPVFSIVLPLYAFWHFDDFSWGTTRQIKSQGDGQQDGDRAIGIKNIPMALLAEYEDKDPRVDKSAPPDQPKAKHKHYDEPANVQPMAMPAVAFMLVPNMFGGASLAPVMLGGMPMMPGMSSGMAPGMAPDGGVRAPAGADGLAAASAAASAMTMAAMGMQMSQSMIMAPTSPASMGMGMMGASPVMGMQMPGVPAGIMTMQPSPSMVQPGSAPMATSPLAMLPMGMPSAQMPAYPTAHLRQMGPAAGMGTYGTGTVGAMFGQMFRELQASSEAMGSTDMGVPLPSIPSPAPPAPPAPAGPASPRPLMRSQTTMYPTQTMPASPSGAGTGTTRFGTHASPFAPRNDVDPSAFGLPSTPPVYDVGPVAPQPPRSPPGMVRAHTLMYPTQPTGPRGNASVYGSVAMPDSPLRNEVHAPSRPVPRTNTANMMYQTQRQPTSPLAAGARTISGQTITGGLGASFAEAFRTIQNQEDAEERARKEEDEMVQQQPLPETPPEKVLELQEQEEQGEKDENGENDEQGQED
ncbi:hypothetical protein GGF32_003623 [Allomyces javanicus]|nr:hypothetical protein GGF32_003623 [Allomyces javanicus]